MLFNTVERVGRMREGGTAIHLHIPALRPQNRGCIQFITVLKIKDTSPDDATTTIFRLRAMFSNDPLT